MRITEILKYLNRFQLAYTILLLPIGLIFILFITTPHDGEIGSGIDFLGLMFAVLFLTSFLIWTKYLIKNIQNMDDDKRKEQLRAYVVLTSIPLVLFFAFLLILLFFLSFWK
jgi:hypothetical protein